MATLDNVAVPDGSTAAFTLNVIIPFAVAEGVVMLTVGPALAVEIVIGALSATRSLLSLM